MSNEQVKKELIEMGIDINKAQKSFHATLEHAEAPKRLLKKEITMDKLVTNIIDLSALYWRNWHASDGDEISSARRKTLGFIRSLYSDTSQVIVALDSPPYLRSKVYDDYKKNRPQKPEAALQELKRCIDEILEDGWMVAKAAGYEADDVIYSLLDVYTESKVWATDKDLLQCCDITEPWTKKIKTAQNTLGVDRCQVVDYLALIGDVSDNIPGVKGVGPKTASAMLTKYRDIEGIYMELDRNPDCFRPSTASALTGAKDWLQLTTVPLITLQNCDFKIEKRDVKKIDPSECGYPIEGITTKEPPSTAITATHEKIAFKQSLEPIGITEAWRVSEAFYQSRLYSKFSNAQAIMVTIMRGRSLGLDATTALDGINVIQGKPTMSAALMVGLVMSNSKCQYLYCDSTTDHEATWVGRRLGIPRDITRTFTIQDAQKMGLVGKDNWQKQPATMLKWRAVSMLIRELFPDVINGLYSTEEMS